MKTRKFVLLVLFLLSLSGISFYGGTVSYGFFFGILLMPVISGIYLVYVYTRFGLYQEVGSRMVVCGQPVPYYFVLQNDDFVAYTSIRVRMFSEFSFVEEVPDHKEYALLPEDKQKYETTLTCKYRGEYEVGVNEVILTDFFQIFRLTYRVPSAVKAVVAPRVVRLKELNSIPEITAYLQNQNLLEQMEPEGSIRDYRQGDSLKRIHWKASAREQKLKVRQMTGEEKQGITILCDAKRTEKDMRDYLPVENQMLEILLALNYFFAENHTKVNNLYRQGDFKNVSLGSIKDFELFYREISSLAFLEEYEFSVVLDQALQHGLLTGSKAVFFILHEIDEKLLETVERLESGGTIIVLFAVTDKDISSYQKMNSARKKIIAVPIDSRIEEVL